MSTNIKYKAPQNATNPYFDIRHSKTIKDKFFFYANKISMDLPAAVVQREGTKYNIKVLHAETREHVTLLNTAGNFGEVVECCAKHFKFC